MRRPPEPGGAPRFGRDRVTALVLFLVCFGVYLASPVTQLHDSRYLTAVSHSLIEDGGFAIAPSIEEHSRGYLVEPHGGRYYHLFPNAPAVLNVPFVWAFDQLGAPVWRDGRFQYDTERWILRVAAAFAAALTAALGFLIARIFLTFGWSLSLAVFFAFGTQLYSTASRAYWSHSWGVALLAVGLYLVLSPRFWQGRLFYVAAASALAWACFCRPTFGLSALALTVPVLARQRRSHLPFFVGSGVVWAALFVVYSQLVYGSTLPPYFSGEVSYIGGISLEKVLRPPREAALGTLVSPGRGLFVYVPLFGLALVLLAFCWRRLESKRLALIGLAVVVGHWLLISSMRNWWGGGCYGPRTFTDVVPWFLVLCALVLQTILPWVAVRPWWARTGWVVTLAVLAGASLFIHARGAVSWETARWGVHDLQWALPELRRPLFRYERLRNWRYPQFLAGLVPVPPPGDFVSWLCEGDERVRRVTCENQLKLRVSGSPGDGFRVRLSTGEVISGRLRETGSVVERVPAAGKGTLTVLWDCGTVVTRPYDCGPQEPAPGGPPGRPVELEGG